MKNKNEKSYLMSWEDFRLQELSDPKKAKTAIKIALELFEEDNDIDSLLETFRIIAKAQGGLAKIAKKSAISRQALNSALSSNGNPKLRTFQTVIESLGFKMSFKQLRN
jgi:probable addiction module antidote protein